MSNKQEMLYGICMIALALQLSAISTEHWSVKKASSVDNAALGIEAGDISMGLWKGCGHVWKKLPSITMDDTICIHLPPHDSRTFPKNSLYAAQAFALMGVILLFVGLMCMMYGKSYKRCQMLCLIAGGLSSILANVIWASEMLKVKPDEADPTIKFSPGYSFYLNLGGGLVTLMAAFYNYNY